MHLCVRVAHAREPNTRNRPRPIPSVIMPRTKMSIFFLLPADDITPHICSYINPRFFYSSALSSPVIFLYQFFSIPSNSNLLSVYIFFSPLDFFTDRKCFCFESSCEKKLKNGIGYLWNKKKISDNNWVLCLLCFFGIKKIINVMIIGFCVFV